VNALTSCYSIYKEIISKKCFMVECARHLAELTYLAQYRISFCFLYFIIPKFVFTISLCPVVL
jgi:hypothetical protein